MVQADAKIFFLSLCSLVTGVTLSLPASAETNLAPINLAQSAPTVPSLYPTDVTPTPIGRERELLRPGPTYYFYQKLPSRLWFNVSTETSQRYESNVFLNRSQNTSDYVYRVLPNVTAGYNLFGRTSLYTNYFVLKDLFANHSQLSFPTTQSLALGLRHEIPINARTNLQFDFQARELWQTTHLHQADLIPGVTLTRTMTPRSIVFANALLQMRGGEYFVAPTRELDPFLTLGLLHSRGAWVYSAVGTLVFNVRHPAFPFSIPDVGNNSIIADFEVSHPVSHKLPGVVAFLRAEPIWNWASRGTPGISGFDFRLFGGLRYTLVKPAYHQSIHKLRKQLKESEPASGKPSTKTPGTPSSGGSPSNSGGTSPGSGGAPPKNSNAGNSPAGSANSSLPPSYNSGVGNSATVPSLPDLSNSVSAPLDTPPLRRAIHPSKELVLDTATWRQ